MYARVLFHEYMEYRTVAGPALNHSELDALGHALVDSQDPLFVFLLIDAAPVFGERSTISFLERFARGVGVMAPAANAPELRGAAELGLEKLLARLEQDSKSLPLLRQSPRRE